MINPQPTTPSDPIRLPTASALAEARRAGVTGLHMARGTARFVGGLRPGGSVKRLAARELRDLFESLGPTYVKFGQLIASSPGVFTPTVSEEFETLLDRVAPAPSEQIEAAISAALGAPVRTLFATFDTEPIASASIAQVHTATTHSGDRVVVKVQRPNLGPRLAADVALLGHAARLLELSSYGKMLSARSVVNDFAAGLNAEIDFRNEARAMAEFIAGIADRTVAERIRVPRVYHDLSAANVLTMEYVDAVRIDDAVAVRSAGHDGVALVRSLLMSFLESAFRGGVFHGDLHAGNVLVDSDGRLVLLDFGIVGRFTPPTRAIMRRLMVDLMVRGDYDAAGAALIDLGAVRNPAGFTTGTGAHDLEKFAKPMGRSGLAKMSYTDMGRQLAALANAYDLRLPPELVLVGKQLLYVEKYMKLLAPRWRAGTDRQVFDFMSELLAEDGPSR